MVRNLILREGQKWSEGHNEANKLHHIQHEENQMNTCTILVTKMPKHFMLLHY